MVAVMHRTRRRLFSQTQYSGGAIQAKPERRS